MQIFISFSNSSLMLATVSVCSDPYMKQGDMECCTYGGGGGGGVGGSIDLQFNLFQLILF